MKIKSYSQTKILVTLGPASSSKEVLRQMFLEGVDVCRLNFSHGTHEQHEKVINIINELDAELDANIAILADLQGPKIRIGDVENGEIIVEKGDEIDFVTERCIGTKEKLYLSYQQFPKDVEKGDMILIDDGKKRLQVIETNHIDRVRARVINGGTIGSKKGVNLPNTKISLPSLTEKDLKDALFALEHNVDWLALSFVRTVQDVNDLRDLIKSKGKDTAIISKIEKPEALDEIDEIIAASDAIMVARGDLGVEVSFDRVPTIQKQIVDKCIEQSKPVIIATQMMESMIENFRPTRAEATDVANAVIDGADALMLSGETSVGKYPVETIKSMEQIISYTEENAFSFYRKLPNKSITRRIPDELCDAAKKLSNKLEANAIICFTSSGYTAYRIAGYRPDAPVFVFTHNKKLLRRLNVVWGVRAFYKDFDNSLSTTKSIRHATQHLIDEKLLKKGDTIVILASSPLQEKGKTNTLKVEVI